MVGIVTKVSSSCDAMMQEIAEASVESILTGIDTTETYGGVPDTPPADDREGTRGWFSPPTTDTTFVGGASWSFCETESSSAQFQPQRQLSSSGNSYCVMSAASGGSTTDTEEGEISRVMSQSASSTPTGITTVMLRNIPNKYTRSGLLSALVERGFDPAGGDCNNLYLPMDAGSGCNLGYAFLNFTTHDRALAFMQQFDGVRLPSAGSRKVCSVVWANKQGLFQHSNPPDMVSKDACNDDNALPPVPGTTCKIFVGGLPSSTTEADLIEYFAKFGPIREASIVTNRQTGQSRGFGFCEFMSPDSVDRVQAAQTRRPHSINCRVVSVRPYNSTDGNPSSVPVTPMQHHQPPMVTSFFMGHGGSIIEYPMYSSEQPIATASTSAYYCSPPFMSY